MTEVNRMTAVRDPKTVKARLMKQLLPMDRLEAKALLLLDAKSRMVHLEKGRPLFQEGKADHNTIYLIRGTLLLKTADGKQRLIKAGTPTTRGPIHNFQPRRCSAWAQQPAQLLIIDSHALDHAIALEQSTLAGMEVAGLRDGGSNGRPAAAGAEAPADEDNSNWMSLMLQSPAFAQIPPSNFQALFMRMEEVQRKKGEVIVQQGAPGDFFYVLKKGACQVTRAGDNGRILPLATLRPGQSFGEEALLTDSPRNANVLALTDVVLMRLSKKDFNELLKDPMIRLVSRKEADRMVAEGARWLDVRLEHEHRESGLPGSLNLPLYLLRLKVKTLDEKSRYVVYCNTGRRGTAATFLLAKYNIDAYCLRGGLHQHQDA